MIFKILLSLLFVIGLMYLFTLILKKIKFRAFTSASNAHSRLQFVESLYIDHNTKITLIKKDDQEILLVNGKNGNYFICDPKKVN